MCESGTLLMVEIVMAPVKTLDAGLMTSLLYYVKLVIIKNFIYQLDIKAI